MEVDRWGKTDGTVEKERKVCRDGGSMDWVGLLCRGCLGGGRE